MCEHVLSISALDRTCTRRIVAHGIVGTSNGHDHPPVRHQQVDLELGDAAREHSDDSSALKRVLKSVGLGVKHVSTVLYLRQRTVSSPVISQLERHSTAYPMSPNPFNAKTEHRVGVEVGILANLSELGNASQGCLVGRLLVAAGFPARSCSVSYSRRESDTSPAPGTTLRPHGAVQLY